MIGEEMAILNKLPQAKVGKEHKPFNSLWMTDVIETKVITTSYCKD